MIDKQRESYRDYFLSAESTNQSFIYEKNGEFFRPYTQKVRNLSAEPHENGEFFTAR